MFIHFFAKWGYLIRLKRHWILRNLLISQALMEEENKTWKTLTINYCSTVLLKTKTHPSVRMAYLYFVPSSLSWSQATALSRTTGKRSASSTIFCRTKTTTTQSMIKSNSKSIIKYSFRWALPTCVIPVNFTQKSESCGFNSGFMYCWKESTCTRKKKYIATK